MALIVVTTIVIATIVVVVIVMTLVINGYNTATVVATEYCPNKLLSY